MCIILRIQGIILLNIIENKYQVTQHFVSLNVRNGFLERMVFNLGLEGSVVFEQLEIGHSRDLEG